MYNFPDPLISALARRECVIVVGSGVSAASKDNQSNRPPTWEQLLLMMLDGADSKLTEAVKKLISEKDYLTAAELLLAKRGEGVVFNVLEREFVRRKFQHNMLHEHLGKLEQRIYITPNYDTIFDTYMRREFTEGVSVKYQTQSDILPWVRSGNVLVIKNHGTIDDRQSIVLTRRQYAEQRVLNAAFFRVVDALFITKTVLFVGCGLSDPDFQLMLEDAALAFPGAPPHYMIKQHSDEHEVIDSAVEGLRNLEMVYYRGGHDLLPDLLAELVLVVNSRRRGIVN